MDGEAIATAFAITPGPDCIRDVVPKVGVRMKVYQAIKRTLEVRYSYIKFKHYKVHLYLGGGGRDQSCHLY